MKEENDVVGSDPERAAARGAGAGPGPELAQDGAGVELRPRLAVCTWSLRPRSVRELVDSVRATGLDAVQLALEPIRTGAMSLEEVRDGLGAAGIRILSGMMQTVGEDYSTLESIRRTGGVVPDETWEANQVVAEECARIAAALGITLVTFHAGFIPHDAADPRRGVLTERIRHVARVFVDHGVRVALETGQETADTLAELLTDLGDTGVGVNFDPANMILYGMGEPVQALRRLAPWVRQVHIKDAIASERPGEWGTEVPVGEGDVDWAAFFATLREAGLRVDLVIEREAGDRRVEDVRRAREVIARHVDVAD